MTVAAIGNILLISGLVPTVLAVLFYARVPWWKSKMGRHLMSYMGILAFLFVILSLRFFVTGEIYTYIRLVVFGVFVIMLWWRLVLIVQMQRASAKVESEKER